MLGLPQLLIALVIVSLSATAIAAEREADEVRDLLLARNAEFSEELIRVSKHVYTVVGVGVQPVSMIIGDDGLVIVDTNIDAVSGKQVMSKFRQLTDKPVRAIVYTHGHLDHTGGAAAFVEAGTEIWARASFGAEDKPLDQAGITITRQRGIRHGGVILPRGDEVDHIGVVPRYVPKQLAQGANPAGAGPLKPTHTFNNEQTTLSIAGLVLELVAADGETRDQLFVWYPEDKVMFSGDNFYKSWPNLYPIRGTGYRDVYAWINSLSAMIEKKPHRLVGGHTRPILSESETTEVLTNYRDAIKFVFDKTIEGMNKGMTPDDLVEYAKLPEKYSELDYLRPYYGHPDWGVRSIFNAYLGWFDGNPTKLFPLTPKVEAEHIAKLAGGTKELRTQFEEAALSKQYPWALQLVDYLLVLYPKDRSLMLSKADILYAMSERVLNGTARNYYRTVALELRQAAEQVDTAR